jgi:hypothetical protein
MILTCIVIVTLYLTGDFSPPGSYPQDQPIIRLNQQQGSGHYGTIEVSGLNPEVLSRLSSRALTEQGWQTLFPVYTGNAIPQLTLDFSEPLDHGLLGYLIEVQGASGGIVPGEIEILDKETRWRFIPDRPWQAGAYTIRIDSRLEDLAGNTLNYLFDVDIQQEGNLSPDQPPYVLLRFEVNP